jgi:hypothetical protein
VRGPVDGRICNSFRVCFMLLFSGVGSCLPL